MHLICARTPLPALPHATCTPDINAASRADMGRTERIFLAVCHIETRSAGVLVEPSPAGQGSSHCHNQLAFASELSDVIHRACLCLGIEVERVCEPHVCCAPQGAGCTLRGGCGADPKDAVPGPTDAYGWPLKFCFVFPCALRLGSCGSVCITSGRSCTCMCSYECSKPRRTVRRRSRQTARRSSLCLSMASRRRRQALATSPWTCAGALCPPSTPENAYTVGEKRDCSTC